MSGPMETKTARLTKQGIRDLNHYGPRKKVEAAPVAVDPEPAATVKVVEAKINAGGPTSDVQ